MENYHTPVLLQTCIDFLRPSRGMHIVDGTLGGGGHTRAILASQEECRVIAFDADAEAIRFVTETLPTERLTLIHGNFRHLKERLLRLGIVAIDGLLLDLGVSSRQLDRAAKGFSYRMDAPLSMRMGDEGPDARDVVNQYDETTLANVMYEFGEERLSRRIAKAIVKRRQKKRIESTQELADAITSVIPARHANKSLSRVFQAIRIEVNRELDNLRQALQDGVAMMRPGGRVVVLSYHSLEDRIVKNFFREESKNRVLTLLTKKPMVPSTEEMKNNPRARSAKLRAAEKRNDVP